MPSAAISIVQIMPSSPLFPSAKLGKTPHWAGTFILLPIKFYTTEQINVLCLKVPKREIFDRSDFPDFYTIKSLREGDFGVKI
jgi:hypothetical protein